MLNELLIVERGAKAAGIEVLHRHPDLREAGKIPTLKVQLDDKGGVLSVRMVPKGIAPWTIRDGQHNSFPFIQPKKPLLIPEHDSQLLEIALDRKNTKRRLALLRLSTDAKVNESAYVNWPGDKMIARLRERRQQLETLSATKASVFLATIDRFLLASDRNSGGNPSRLIEDIVATIIELLETTADSDFVQCAAGLLIGENVKSEWQCEGALVFEASGYDTSIIDPRLVVDVSRALTSPGTDLSNKETIGTCALTGTQGALLQGNFPQPNLPELGQTWLFAKNKEIPANDRYGRFANDAMPVSIETVVSLDATLRALTQSSRKNITWRTIPSETPKKRDLFLAFVEKAPDTPAAEVLAEDDFSEEEKNDSSTDRYNSVAVFEKKAERLIDTLQAKLQADLESSHVQLVVLRKVDQANRKVAYAGSLTVGDLVRTSRTWSDGERNVPPWLELPVFFRVERKSRSIKPPHVAPLGLIALSKALFVRNGKARQEVAGLSASDALEVFLASAQGDRHFKRLVGILRLILVRRTSLVAGTAHALRRPQGIIGEYDSHEALRTITTIGVLLHKLERTKEVYMNESAFKLGQLLAAADVVHAGYCADVRKGEVPPTLLGNQVFAMAQKSPKKALATLCRRWKPYDGWAKKTVRDREKTQEIQKLINSKRKEDQQRGWDIRKALRYAREMRALASDLAPAIEDQHVDDMFNAELLLGYIAGLPKAQKEESKESDEEQIEGQEE